jgi:hypothetical protein
MWLTSGHKHRNWISTKTNIGFLQWYFWYYNYNIPLSMDFKQQALSITSSFVKTIGED